MSKLKLFVISGFLLLTSPAVLGQIEIHSVVTDPPGNQIVVKGSGLTGIAPGSASLGGVPIPDPIIEPDGSQMTIAFGTETASAVTEQGSYLLEVRDILLTPTRFSAYFDTPIIPPVTPGGCPCEGIWDTYGARSGKRGFAGLTPSFTCGTLGDPQLAVQFWDDKFSNVWVLTTEYDASGVQDCALEIDEPLVEFSAPDASEHDACSAYLVTNYMAPGGASTCDSTYWPLYLNELPSP